MPTKRSPQLSMYKAEAPLKKGYVPNPSKAHVWRVRQGSTRPYCKQCGLVWEEKTGKPKSSCPGKKEE